MATNNVHPEGDKWSLPVPADTPSGTFVLVGDQGLFGVTVTAEGEGGNAAGYASVWAKGIWDLPVSTTTALDIGDKVYATPAGVLTTTSNTNANAHVGWAYGPKSTTANEVIPVKLAKV